MENTALAARWTVQQGRPGGMHVAHRASDSKLTPADTELFKIRLADGRILKASELRVATAASLQRIEAQPNALRRCLRQAGWIATASLATDDGTRIQWQAILRDEAHYLRQELHLVAGPARSPVQSLILLDCQAAAAQVSGTVDGSPIVAGPFFLACEHPMSSSQVDGQHATCSVGLFGTLEAGADCARSWVVGVASSQPMRRSFSSYLEQERPRPYQPFLHYNSWYDIAWGDRKMDEAGCLDVIQRFGRELVQVRNVCLDSVVFDDGWDDNRTLWGFHAGFPRGFDPLQKAAAKYQTAIGVWLSPWGGYGSAKKERLEYGRQEGFEMNRRGFSLAGPKYYARFREVCLEMVRRYGVNYFKFDGIAQGSTVTGAGEEFAPDIQALLRLVEDLRAQRPDLFVNITTGTWPSPFWLLWGDSIWRSGSDMGFHGPGSKRQQWITYRDMITYQGVVRRGPLFPIHSLMTQGIAQSRLGHAASLGDDLREMAQEIHSFFATGTQLQELYVSPQRLTPAMWDLLAEGARWSRQRADVLRDAHWIGGDPGRAEVYGIAAWSPTCGMLMLRNPSDQSKVYDLDLKAALELPHGDPGRLRLTNPWPQASQPPLEISPGQACPLRLAPFEVLVFEAKSIGD